MKQLLKICLFILWCLPVQASASFETAVATSAPVRLDTRTSFGGRLVCGTEQLGSLDGAAVTAWDTTAVADGWQSVTSDATTAQLYVLNNSSVAVVGGRLTESVIWSKAVTHVVRRWVVVPSGVTLTLTEGAVVKFCPETGIFVEDGGKVELMGADGADVILTSVNDDSQGAVIDCGEAGAGNPGGIRLQSSAATLSDNNYVQTYGFTLGSFATVSVNDTTAIRNGGVAYVVLDVAGSRTTPFSVDWEAVDGTAKFGEDYTLARGTLTWSKVADGRKTLAIPLNTANITGETRTFTVKLTTGHCANFGDAEATVTIVERESVEMAWGESPESASVRFDARTTLGGKIVQGTEGLGETDGSAWQIWDTTTEANGWQTRTSGDQSEQVCVMNDPEFCVEGGRLTGSVTWANEVTHVVRSWVVVPKGVTLTLTAGTIVKFAPGTGIFVEDGGQVDVVGASGADVIFTRTDDDSVGAIVDCGGLGAGAPGGLRVQTSAATLTDNGFMQVRGFSWSQFPSVSVADTTAFRADGVANVTFTLSGATREKAFSIDWVAVDETAKLGEDYTLASGTITWNKSAEGNKTIQIPLVKDNLTGEVRTFQIRITTAHSATIADGEATVEIREYTYLPIDAGVSEESAVVRFDTRDSLGGQLVCGTEQVGEPDGSAVTAWDTTTETDGWQTLTRDANTKNLFVLNDAACAVEGGRLATSQTWANDVTHVVRRTVVVPKGVTLTVTAGTIVKFCPGTCIFIEDGGKLNVVGAQGSDVIFTAVNDDTVGAVVDCGALNTTICGQIQLQSSAATFTDNGYIQTRGFTSAPGYGTVTVHDAMTDRKNGKIYLAFTVTGSRDHAFSVDWQAEDDSAKFGEDYLLQSGTVTWNKASEGTKWISIPIVTEPTGDRRQFKIQIVTARGVIVADGEATAEIQEMSEVQVVGDVTLQTSDASSAFFIDGEVGAYPIIPEESISLTYSPYWQKIGNGATMQAGVTLENEAFGVKTLVAAPPGEEGTYALDLTQLEPGSYTLTHTIYTEQGEEAHVLKKTFAIVDPATTVLHGGVMTENEVWETGKTHLVYKDVIVPAHLTILLEPGAIVKFVTGTCIDIKTAGGGALFANGVIFTHVNDDTVGGDTLLDGSALAPDLDGYQLLGNLTIGEDSEMRFIVQVTDPLQGTIAVSRTLLRGSIYKVTGDVTIASGATLTIPQGTILKFAAGKKLTVSSGATLNANGTRAAPVIFTSMKDDAHGGDTNEDGDATVPQPGDWDELLNNGGTVNLTSVFARYAGFGEYSNQGDAIIRTNSGTTMLDGCVIEGSSLRLLGCSGGTVKGSNCVFRDGRWGVDGGATIVNCVISDCETGSNNATIINSVFNNCISGVSGGTIRNCVFWNAGNVVGTNSAEGDPMFVDPANGDFRTQPGSACVDAADGAVAPLLDAYGQPRFDSLEVENTGAPNEEGAYPDIGIYEAVPRTARADIDLMPQTLSASESVTPGGTIAVRWTILNQGGATVEDSWRDTIYLVSEAGQTVELGTKVNGGIIAAGGSYAANAYFTVPPLAEGAWYPKVVVNAERDIYEGIAYDDNVLTGTTAITVAVPVGEASGASGTLKTNAPTVLKFSFEDAGSQIGRLNLPAGAKVYYGLGFVPTASANSGALTSTGEKLLFTVPEGTKDVYILIEGAEGSYDISFTEGALEIGGVEPNTIPNNGTTTIVVNGAGFTKDIKVQFKNGEENVVAEKVYCVSAEQLAVHVDCSNFSIGHQYDIVVSTSNDIVKLGATINVVSQTSKGNLVAKLHLPSAIRDGRIYPAWVEYSNTGDAEIPIPIFVVRRVGGNATLGVNQEDVFDKTELYLLGVSPTIPCGYLKPGESGRIVFYIRSFDALSLALDVVSEKSYKTGEGLNGFDTIADYQKAMAEAASRIGLRGASEPNFTDTLALALNERRDANVSVLSGRVLHALTGEPISDCIVKLEAYGTNDLSRTVCAQTDKSGFFSLETFDTGDFLLSASNQEESQFLLYNLNGKDYNSIKLQCLPYNTISGFVYDEDFYNIVANAGVGLCKGETVISIVETDDFGSFTFSNIEAGNYSLLLYPKNGYSSVRGDSFAVTNGVTIIRNLAYMSKGIVVSGKVIHEITGEVITNGTLKLVNMSKDSGYSSSIQSDGSFIFDGVEIADYELSIATGNYVLSKTFMVTNYNEVCYTNLALNAIEKAPFNPTVSMGMVPFVTVFEHNLVDASGFEWDFNNDGIVDSYDANPSWKCEVVGEYSVRMKYLDSNNVEHMTLYPNAVIAVPYIEDNIVSDNGLVLTADSGVVVEIVSTNCLVLVGIPPKSYVSGMVIGMKDGEHGGFIKKVISVTEEEGDRWVLSVEDAKLIDLYDAYYDASSFVISEDEVSQMYAESFVQMLSLDEPEKDIEIGFEAKNEPYVAGIKGGVGRDAIKSEYCCTVIMINGKKEQVECYKLQEDYSFDLTIYGRISKEYEHEYKPEYGSKTSKVYKALTAHKTISKKVPIGWGFVANFEVKPEVKGSLNFTGEASVTGKIGYHSNSMTFVKDDEVVAENILDSGFTDKSLSLSLKGEGTAEVSVSVTAGVYASWIGFIGRLGAGVKCEITGSYTHEVAISVGEDKNLIDTNTRIETELYTGLEIKAGLLDLDWKLADKLTASGEIPFWTYKSTASLKDVSFTAGGDGLYVCFAAEPLTWYGENFPLNILDGVEMETSAYWRFGDGSLAKGRYPSHTYKEPGSYTVTYLAQSGKCDIPVLSALDMYKYTRKTINVFDDRPPETEEIDNGSRTPAQSCDPNEIAGPLGKGDPETERLVLPGEWLNYTIYFENKSDATAAAQEVLVTLPLSEQLDWTTFTLGDVTFNNQADLSLVDKQSGTSEVALKDTSYYVRTQVTFDQQTGVAQWYLRVIDKSTDDYWPSDPYAGFLPPNDPETHCGEGHLSFRIQVAADAKIGEVIDTSATIVFDYNPPIETDPAWWNVVGFSDESLLDWEYVLNEDGTGVTITGLKPQNVRGAIRLPAELGGYSVTAIGEGAFQNHEWISSVTIPKGVKAIGADAFAGCSHLATITFLGNPPTLGANAFDGIANPCTGNYYGTSKNDWQNLIGDDGTWNGLTMVRLASVEPELKWRYYDGTGTYFGQLIVATTGDALKEVEEIRFAFEDRLQNTAEGVVGATLWNSATKTNVTDVITATDATTGATVALRTVALPDMVKAFQAGEAVVTNGVKDLSASVISQDERTIELFSRRRVEPWSNTALFSASLMCVEGVNTNYYALAPNDGSISAAAARLLHTPTGAPLSAETLNMALALQTSADPALTGVLRIEEFAVTETTIGGEFSITATTAKSSRAVTQLGENAKVYIYGSSSLTEPMACVQELTSADWVVTGDTLAFEIPKPEGMSFFRIYLDIGTVVE